MHVDSAGGAVAGWPEGMTIMIEDRDPELLALLFSRAVRGLRAGTAVPTGLTSDPPPLGGTPGDAPPGLSAEWDAAWALRLEHLDDLDDFDIEGRGLDAYFAAWQAAQDALPVPWSDRMQEWLDSSGYVDWVDSACRRTDLDIRPGVLPALVGAWRRGLRTVTLLPLTGPYVLAPSPQRMVVSAFTWSSDEEMVGALRSWTGEKPPQPDR